MSCFSWLINITLIIDPDSAGQLFTPWSARLVSLLSTTYILSFSLLPLPMKIYHGLYHLLCV